MILASDITQCFFQGLKMAKSRSGDAEVGSDEKTQRKTTMMMSDGKPDGGCLAWTIVAASFMVSFLQDGFR